MNDDPPPGDPVASIAPGSDSHITLFCPHCDYNLTGLPENRCPECGRPFDPQELRVEAAENPRPISTRAALLHLLWPPVACSLAALTGSDEVYRIAAIVLLIGAMPNAFMVAERIVAGRAAKRDMGFSRTRDWKWIVFLWLALYAAQLIVAAIFFAVQATFSVPLH